MRIKLKNQPKLALNELLRRRKSTLKLFLEEQCITTYGGLIAKCDMLGVLSPTETEFMDAYGTKDPVNSPQEGVVVVEPETLCQTMLSAVDDSNDKIDVEQTPFDYNEIVLITSVQTATNNQEEITKTSRKKKAYNKVSNND